jgi:hypothetical protein
MARDKRAGIHDKGDGPRTQIKGDYGSPVFMAEYEAAKPHDERMGNSWPCLEQPSKGRDPRPA